MYYAKGILAAVYAFLGVLSQVIMDGVVDTPEWADLAAAAAIAVVGVINVVKVPNRE